MNLNQSGRLSFKVNILAVGPAWVAAIVFGLLNTHVGWLSPLIHLFYLLLVAILKLTVHVYGKMANGQTAMGINARYMLSRMARGKMLNWLLQAIVWLVAGIMILVQVLCNIITHNSVFMVVDLGLDMMMLCLSCVSNIVLALLLCASVRQIHVS